MKIINNIMILALLVLPAYSAGVSDGFESIESVFRVRNMSELEDFQTKLRHLLEQHSALQVRLVPLIECANCFATETDTLVEKMGLTLDQDFINSMGAEFRGVNVASYKYNRVDLTDCVRSLEGYCSRWCEKANLSMVENLILVDEFLIPIDLTGGVRAFPDSGSLGCDDKAVCSYEDQAPAPNDFMPRLENFIAAIQDTQRLTQEHLISVVACINSVDEIAQDEGSSDDHGSDLARLCEKSKLNKTLLNYKAYLSGALDAPMSKCLNMLTKCLEKERAFRSKENPLVVLQEESSEFTLHERLKNVRDNLDEFMKMEREISTRLKKLARCAPFFIEYKFKKYVRRFPQLGMDHVYWYDYVLRRQLAEFISTEDLLRRRAEGNFSDIVKAQKVLHDSDGDIVLPPIQVECDLQGNDLCGNLDIFVKILKEIELWEVRQSRQKESLQRSVFGVVCDQTAKATLGDKFSYIQALKQDLLGHLFRDQNKRRTMVDTQLFVLSEFLQLIISTEKNRSGLCRKRRFSAAFEKNRSGVCRKRRFAD